MGLSGLYACVNQNNLFDKIRLRNTKLVIDGYGLLRHLYNGRNIEKDGFGGEYKDYQKNCKVFFDNLQKCGIVPYVVFDGAWDLNDKKYATHIQRHQQKLDKAKRISKGSGRNVHDFIMPLFAWSILQTMAKKRAEVFTVTVDFEADEEIATLANHLECPVLANDNDFFIYPLVKGYIPFEKMNVQTKRSQEENREQHYLDCSIFSAQDHLCQLLGIDKKRLPLLATIRGNDYLTTDTLEQFHNDVGVRSGYRFASSAFYALGHWLASRRQLSDNEVVEEVLDIMKLDGKKRQDVLTEANQSIQTYSMSMSTQSSIVDLEKLETWVPRSGGFESFDLPLDVVQNLRKGNLHSVWINVLRKGEFLSVKQIEDFSQCSANDISRELRAVIYALLLGNKLETVTEHDRVSGNHKATKNDILIPQRLMNGEHIPSISDVYELPIEERKVLVLNSLGHTERDLPFRDQLQLPMAVTRYWYHKSKCPKHIARGLLMGFLLYSDSISIFNDVLRPLPGRYADILPCVHAFAEWQSCLMFASDLNVLLNYPLQEFNIVEVFNGHKTNQLAAFACNNNAFEKKLEKLPVVKSEFLKMWNYVESSPQAGL